MFTTHKLQGAGGVGGGGTVEYITSVIRSINSGSNGTLVMPTCQAGDILVVMQMAWDNYIFPPTLGYGAGFTACDTTTGYWTQDGGYYRIVASSYKIATSGDSGFSTSGFCTGYTHQSLISVYRPSSQITSISVLDKEKESIIGTPSTRTINCSASGYSTISVVATSGCLNTVSLTPNTRYSNYHASLSQATVATDVVATFSNPSSIESHSVLTHYLQIVI